MKEVSVIMGNDEVYPLLSNGNTENVLGTNSKKQIWGYLIIFFSACLFSFVDFLIKIATTELNIPAQNILFVRGVIFFVLSFSCSVMNQSLHELLSITKVQRFAIIGYGLVLAIFQLLLYKALRSISVGDITAIMYTCPAFTILFSLLFLSEPVKKVDFFVVSLEIGGIVLISNSAETEFDKSSKAEILALLFSVCLPILIAFSFILIRLMGEELDPVLTLLPTSVCFVLLAVFEGGYLTFHECWEYGVRGMSILIGTAVLSFFLTFMMIKGFQLCPAGPGSIVKTGGLPVAYLFGTVFLGEELRWQSISGSAVIIIGILIRGIDMHTY